MNFKNGLLVVTVLRMILLYVKDYFSIGQRSISNSMTSPSLPFLTGL